MSLTVSVLCLVLAQAAPTRVDTAVAMKQIVKKVDPVFSADALAANPGAPFAADVVIGTDGRVESVNVIVGPNALRPAAVAALKQWTFKPFTSGGRPIRAMTIIDIKLADPVREAENKAVDEYFTASNACVRSLANHAADAETVCTKLAQLAERLPPDRVLEKSGAFQALGFSLLQTNKSTEALVQFDRAVSIRRTVAGDSDADTASLYQIVARTHADLRNVPSADEFYRKAIDTFERALLKVPILRDNYTERLNDLVREYADFKRAIGQTAEARALDAKADGLPVPTRVRGIPVPAAKRVAGVLCLGPTGPMLTDDDVRKIVTFAPAGKKIWLLFGHSELTIPSRHLWVDVYLEPDVSTSILRRGAVIRAVADLPATGPITVAKSWSNDRSAVSYAQVPLAGRDPADIRGTDDRNRPVLVMKAPGDELTDGELVAVIAVVRAAGEKPPTNVNAPVMGRLYTDVQLWPIEEILRWSSGDVLVRLTEGRTLDGHGQLITLKRTGNVWNVVEILPR